MSIQNCFADFLEENPVDIAQLTTFSEHIPDEWVAKATSLSDKAAIRRRRLPSDMVLWLIVGMAFFRNEPIAEVARRMNSISATSPIWHATALTVNSFTQPIA
ncbi:transposase domain-containing protein [Vibrio alginolyticus]|uniref:transposase domain-containing protein n=1 Tax=Vibrio alginolyticus TaxID=663 RepID=UPI00215D55FB|nr:transposase domain-containing protein [Vibrio alginolyticus]MCR9883868.1 transposase domain-containing protein [Vibrio alginolyticus]